MKPVRQAIILGSLAVASTLAFGASGIDDGVSVRRFTLPQRGYLEIKAPSRWQAQVTQPPKSIPPTISFAPRDGKPFIVTFTPVWQTAKAKVVHNKDELHKRVASSAEGIRPFAVEQNINLIEIEGASGPGFYFSATDQSPRGGDYKFMTKGEILVNDLEVQFTILSNDGQESVVLDALTMLQSANHVRTVKPPNRTRQNDTSEHKR